jgi:hypothetical protein
MPAQLERGEIGTLSDDARHAEIELAGEFAAALGISVLDAD